MWSRVAARGQALFEDVLAAALAKEAAAEAEAAKRHALLEAELERAVAAGPLRGALPSY